MNNLLFVTTGNVVLIQLEKLKEVSNVGDMMGAVVSAESSVTKFGSWV
jgi:hypothetical protein